LPENANLCRSNALTPTQVPSISQRGKSTNLRKNRKIRTERVILVTEKEEKNNFFLAQ
jgi:hypothetical protein